MREYIFGTSYSPGTAADPRRGNQPNSSTVAVEIAKPAFSTIGENGPYRSKNVENIENIENIYTELRRSRTQGLVILLSRIILYKSMV